MNTLRRLTVETRIEAADLAEADQVASCYFAALFDHAEGEWEITEAVARPRITLYGADAPPAWEFELVAEWREFAPDGEMEVER